MNPKKKKPTHSFVDQNPIEAHTGSGTNIVNTAFEEGEGIVKNLWDQILNVGREADSLATSGDLTEGQELILSKASEYIEPAIDYRREIIHSGERAVAQQTRTIEYQVEEILVELKALADTTAELKLQFTEIAVERVPQNAGKYHVNFFELMLSTISAARQKVESSRNWLAAASKKGKKKGYWDLFAEQGTTFGMSNERNVATQVG